MVSNCPIDASSWSMGLLFESEDTPIEQLTTAMRAITVTLQLWKGFLAPVDSK